MAGFNDMTDQILTASQEAFGEAVTYIPYDSAPVEVSGIFDRLYLAIDPATTAIVQGYDPKCSIREAELLDALGRIPDLRDRVTIRLDTFKIIEIEPDGRGDYVLMLHKETP